MPSSQNKAPRKKTKSAVDHFKNYQVENFYDESFFKNRKARAGIDPLIEKINSLSKEDLIKQQKAATSEFMQQGITFTVYGEEFSEEGTEKIFPFDIMPRVISASEWAKLEKGLKQRIKALNMFVHDIYHEQKIIKSKKIPKALINAEGGFMEECIGLEPPNQTWIHISGIDLIRNNDGEFYVLEDNLRCPSGVSYVLENREVLKRTFPGVFDSMNIRAVDDYPHKLLETLQQAAPHANPNPTVVVLTPGVYNSAYFEHAFLARQMGVPLVEGRDLVVRDGYVMMRTTQGYQRVDVIYKRVDDAFMDPEVFRKDSTLGIPGIMEVYKAGRVTLANAPGTGVADNKAIYNYVPEMIRYYLKEEPILNNVPTYLCSNAKQRKYVIDNIGDLVVKEISQSGGYGMLIGPASTEEERKEFIKKIKAKPANYIAQPTLSLSRVPVICEENLEDDSKSIFEARHVDLRPFILYGEETNVLPGGLTRVALKKGSLVVNSSQGGGSKDTWVIADAKSSPNRQNGKSKSKVLKFSKASLKKLAEISAEERN